MQDMFDKKCPQREMLIFFISSITSVYFYTSRTQPMSTCNVKVYELICINS